MTVGSAPAADAPAALLLDAGNTVVFLACDVIAELLQAHGQSVDAGSVSGAQAVAHRDYARRMREGAGHESGWLDFMRALVCAAGVERAHADDAVAMLRAEHDVFNLWRRVPSEIPPALARVRARGIPLALVSNSEGKLDALLGRVGLGDAFDLVIDSALEGVRKPDPEIFWRACRRLDVKPERCLYAGDIPDVDIEGARRAGLDAALIDAIGIHRNYREAPRYDSLAQLIDAIWPS